MLRLRRPCRTQAMKCKHYSYLQCWNYHLLPLLPLPTATVFTYYLLLQPLPTATYCCNLLPTATTTYCWSYLLPLPKTATYCQYRCLLPLSTATVYWHSCLLPPTVAELCQIFKLLLPVKVRPILTMATWRGRPYFYRNSLEIWHSTATIATPTTTAVAVIYCNPCCHYILLRPLPTGVLTGFANYHHSLLPQ